MEEQATIDLGFLLLSLSSTALDNLGKSMAQMTRKAKFQKNHHDLTFPVADSGITINFSNDSNRVAAERLRRHCEKRKYIHKAKSWFGLCINPENSQLRFGVELVCPWEQSDAMDVATGQMSVGYKTLADARSVPVKPKVGRNDPCICGSGKKFKKCCLGK